MKIYGNPYSPGTRLALMACEEKNVPYELVVLDFAKRDHKQPAHIARQPFAKMPAAEHDGLVLFESRAIARFIAEAFDGTSLIPTDVRERALMDQWMNVEAMEFYPIAHPLCLEILVKPLMGMGNPDPAKVEAMRASLLPVLEVLDRALEGKSFLVADQLTLADMVYMGDLEYLWLGGEGPRLEKFTNLTRWWNNISSRPSWQKLRPAK